MTLTLFPILKVQSLSESKRKLPILNFNKLSKVIFPSLLEQLKTRFWAQMELDRQILNVLNLKEEEVERFLLRPYDATAGELAKLKESSREE